MGKQSRLRAVRKRFKEEAARQGIPAQVMAQGFIQHNKKPKRGMDWFLSNEDPMHDEAIKCINTISKKKQ